MNIRQTLSSKSETVSRISRLNALAEVFPLPWSHYVLLIGKTRSHEARVFYHAEALRGEVGKFTHADAGQMHLYLNYARAHWTQPAENPPVGLILCSEKNEAIARYALEGLPSKVLAREYRLALPAEKRLAAEIEQTRERLEARRPGSAARTR